MNKTYEQLQKEVNKECFDLINFVIKDLKSKAERIASNNDFISQTELHCIYTKLSELVSLVSKF